MALQGFHDERLELCIDIGQQGGSSLDTTVITVRGGRDYRNSNWPAHKGAWEVGGRRCNREEYTYMRDFMLRRRGAAIGFRFRDWLDHTLTDQPAREINATEYQCVRTYGADDEHAYRVDIIKPVGSTCVVSVGGVAVVEGVSVDDTTGRIRFDSPPAGRVTVTGEFDKPVRFAVDSVDATFDAYDPTDGEYFAEVSSVPIIELRDTEV